MRILALILTICWAVVFSVNVIAGNIGWASVSAFFVLINLIRYSYYESYEIERK